MIGGELSNFRGLTWQWYVLKQPIRQKFKTKDNNSNKEDVHIYAKKRFRKQIQLSYVLNDFSENKSNQVAIYSKPLSTISQVCFKWHIAPLYLWEPLKQQWK